MIHIQNLQQFWGSSQGFFWADFSPWLTSTLGVVYGSYSSWAHAILIDTSAWVALQRHNVWDFFWVARDWDVFLGGQAARLLKIRAAHWCGSSGWNSEHLKNIRPKSGAWFVDVDGYDQFHHVPPLFDCDMMGALLQWWIRIQKQTWYLPRVCLPGAIMWLSSLIPGTSLAPDSGQVFEAVFTLESGWKWMLGLG